MDLTVSLVGLMVGFLVGLTGMGGGALLTPIMILFFKVSPVLAVGVDFIYSTITKAFGTYIHVKQEHVDFGIARRLSYGSVPAVLLSTILVHSFHNLNSTATNDFLKHSIGIVLLLAAVFIGFRSQLL